MITDASSNPHPPCSQTPEDPATMTSPTLPIEILLLIMEVASLSTVGKMTLACLALRHSGARLLLHRGVSLTALRQATNQGEYTSFVVGCGPDQSKRAGCVPSCISSMLIASCGLDMALRAVVAQLFAGIRSSWRHPRYVLAAPRLFRCARVVDTTWEPPAARRDAAYRICDREVGCVCVR